jgi:hypothetical protein
MMSRYHMFDTSDGKWNYFDAAHNFQRRAQTPSCRGYYPGLRDPQIALELLGLADSRNLPRCITS